MKHGFVFPSPSGLKSLWQNIPLFFQAPFRSGIFWNLADDAAATALQSRGRENRQNGHRCSGGHPACRRAVASSPAANNVGHPPGPGYFMTRQNPTVISGRQDGRPPRQAGRPTLHRRAAVPGRSNVRTTPRIQFFAAGLGFGLWALAVPQFQCFSISVFQLFSVSVFQLFPGAPHQFALIRAIRVKTFWLWRLLFCGDQVAYSALNLEPET